MFLGLAWYWWIIFAVIFLLSLPLKIKFINWWSGRQKKGNQNDRWGDE
ncbi:hypothetical protein IGI67_000944 [Enterococcus sp. AZ196]